MYRSCINRLCIDYVKVIKLLNGHNVSYKSLVRQIPQPFDGESVLSVFSANIEPCQRIWEQRSFNPWLMNRRIMRCVDIAIVWSWTSMRKGHVQRIHSSTCNHRCNWWPTCMAIDVPIFSHPFYMICLLNIGYSRYPHVWRVYPKHLSLAVSLSRSMILHTYAIWRVGICTYAVNVSLYVHCYYYDDDDDDDDDDDFD